MSDIDYTRLARTPLKRLDQLRTIPVDQLAAFLDRCAPITRQALDRLFQAQ